MLGFVGTWAPSRFVGTWAQSRGGGTDGGGVRRSNLTPVLLALFFVSAATQSAIVPLLPGVEHVYRLTAASTGLLLAAPGLATLAVSMPAGMVADRLGARRVTIAATVLLCAGAFAQAGPSYPALIAGRVAFGLAFGVLWTTGVAWLSQSHRGSGSPSLGAISTSAAVGLVAGPAIGGALGDQFGLAAPFLLLASLSAVLALPLAREPAPDPAAVIDRRDHSLRSFIRQAPHQPGVLSAALALAVTGTVSGVTQLLIPLQLHQAGFTAAATGLAFSAAAGIYIAVSATVVKLGRRATSTRWVSLAAMGLALSLLPAVLDPGSLGLVVVLLLSTAPRAVVSTVSYPLAAESAAGAELGGGIAIGLLNGAWAAGLVLAPLIAGTLDQLAGTQTAYLTAVVPGLLVSGWLVARDRRSTATGELSPASA